MIRLSWVRICAVISIVLLGSGVLCGAEGTENADTFTDSTGTSITFRTSPKRVVSLAPSLTRQIVELGLGDSLVGVTTFCDIDVKSSAKRIGTLIQPSMEKIAGVKPDLVLATKEGNRPEIGAKIRSLGLQLFVFKERSSFQDICEEFALLGNILGKKEQAEELITQARKRIEKVKVSVEGKAQRKVFLAYGTDPIIGAAKGTFGDEMVTIAGGKNVSHDSSIRYPMYGKERLAREDPDIVLLSAMGFELKRAMKGWKKMPWLRAVKNNAVHAVEPDPLCSPTPTTYCDGLEKIVSILHPGSQTGR